MLRELWDNYTSIASVSYEYMNSKSSYIYEFYISILAKLLCANFLERRAVKSNDTELKSIIDGSFFTNHQLVNFAEYDRDNNPFKDAGMSSPAFTYTNVRNGVGYMCSCSAAQSEWIKDTLFEEQ